MKLAWILAAGVALASLGGGCGSTVVVDGGSGGSGAGSGTGASTSTGPGCDCDAPSVPVCGVDGNDYDAACGDRCVPVEIACRSACPCGAGDRCDVIAGEYRKALEAARVCESLAPVAQCNVVVASGLICGCPTFVNENQREALDQLNVLGDEWNALGCDPGIGCVPCPPPPSGGRCEPDAGETDLCVDVF